MIQLYQSAFLKALGWSLFNSVWQMGLCWLLYICLTANGKLFKSAQRHNLALLSVGGGCIWFVGDLAVNLFRLGKSPHEATGLFLDYSAFFPFIDTITSLLSVAYLFVVVILISRFIWQFSRHQQQINNHLQVPDFYLLNFIEAMSVKLKITRKIGLWLSETADTPLTTGFLNPMILLPIAAVNQLSLHQTEAIILHEMYHIKRNDYLINLAMSLLTIFLFFNPFARILAAIINKERENSCDDKVLECCFNPYDYSDALLKLEHLRNAEYLIPVAATGPGRGLLINRIRRMLKLQPTSTPVLPRLAACVLVFFLIGISGERNDSAHRSTNLSAIEKPFILPVMRESKVPTVSPSETHPVYSRISRKVTHIVKLRNTERSTGSTQTTAISKDLPDTLPRQFLQQQEAFYYAGKADRALAGTEAVDIPRYAGGKRERAAYSLENEPAGFIAGQPATMDILPYVPSSTFQYYDVEDSLKCKKSVRIITHDNGLKEFIIDTYSTERPGVKTASPDKKGILNSKNRGDRIRKIVHI